MMAKTANAQTNENFNRILGGLRNFIKDEVRIAVREEIYKAKKEAAARRMSLANAKPAPITANPTVPSIQIGQFWISKDKRRPSSAVVITTVTANDVVIYRRFPSEKMITGKLSVFTKRYKPKETGDK
jgi:hypothetical protein